MNIPTFTPHPLREIIISKGITLSQLRAGMKKPVSESRLSFFLTGKRIMKPAMEQDIRDALVSMGVL